MKPITAVLSLVVISSSLVGCNTLYRTADASTTVVNSGVGVITTGTEVATETVGFGFDTVLSPVGYPYYRNDPIYFNNPVYYNNPVSYKRVIYRRGHTYQLSNGRYVRLD